MKNLKLQDLDWKDLLIYIATLTGITIPSLFKYLFADGITPWYAYFIIALFLTVFYIIFGKKKYKLHYSLLEGSKEEAGFFNEWYQQECDELIVFCTDLNWMDNNNYLPVIKTLKTQGNKTKIYLANLETKGKLVEELKLFHVNVFHIKDDIHSNHSLSIIKINDHSSIIIRNKLLMAETQQKTNFIEIDEYPNNTAIVNLALDMLDDCVDPKSEELINALINRK